MTINGNTLPRCDLTRSHDLLTEPDFLTNYERFLQRNCDGCGLPKGDRDSSIISLTLLSEHPTVTVVSQFTEIPKAQLREYVKILKDNN